MPCAPYGRAVSSSGARLLSAASSTSGPSRQGFSRGGLLTPSSAAIGSSRPGYGNLRRGGALPHVLAVLKKIKFFQDLEPRVQAKIPTIVSELNLQGDTVIFRQGDPPGNCYVLLKGEIGIYQMKDGDEDEGSKGPSQIPSRVVSRRPSVFQESASEPCKAAAQAVRGSLSEESCRQERLSEEIAQKLLDLGDDQLSETEPQKEPRSRGLSVKEPQQEAPLVRIQPTTEGFSVYSTTDDLGKRINLLRDASICGELALSHDHNRGASVKCHTYCTMLVIKRADFDRVLKEEVLHAEEKKLHFLTDHLPGMRHVEVPRCLSKPHPAYFLRHATYRRGHHFFTQGRRSETAIYIVFDGRLEIRHQDAGSSPLKRRPARALSMGAYSIGGYAERETQQHAAAGPRLLGTFMAGSVFGSLPTHSPEPYSVIVSSSSCEVFQATGSDLAKLPRQLLETVRDYIATVTAWRLRTYVHNKCSFEMPKASDLLRSADLPVSGARTSQERNFFSVIHAG